MIPKIVHVSWKNKDVLQSTHPLIELGIKNFLKLNPEWTLEFSTDDDVDYYLKQNLSYEDYKVINFKHVVEKIDLWRLFKIYNEGGMYLDIDRVCNRNISEYFDPKIKWILPICRYYDFSHDIMISDKGNPAFANAIKLNIERRKTNNFGTYFLGTETYMHAVSYSLIGEMVNVDPGKETFDKIINVINQSTFIQTHIENPPCDTLLYKQDTNTIDHESLKRDFYGGENTKHWTGEW